MTGGAGGGSRAPAVRTFGGSTEEAAADTVDGVPASVSPPRVRVPFVDLGHANASVRQAVLDAIARLVDSGAFTNGRQIGELERALASYCGVRECVGVASGLDALRLGLLAAGLRPGDEVVVPALTFAATAEAVVQAGGRPVFADIDEADYGLAPACAAAAVGPATRALLPVHLYGQMADVRALRELATGSGLLLVEDACQAHGAERDGVRAGAAGTAAAFSFYPAKNLGAFGDAGAIATDDETLAERARALREHGQRSKYRHELVGYTARLDTIQAIVLLEKLPLLDRLVAERRAAASYYLEALAGVGDLVLPRTVPGSEHSWHLFVVRTAKPEALAAHLAGRGIESGRHYPVPLHLAPAYRWLGNEPGDFPVAEALAREALSLPLYAGIEERQLEAVVGAVEEYFARG